MKTECLDKTKDVPIYYQLYLILKEKIESGVYPENSTIPSESEIQNMFNVSRITVRRAITDLENDGYVKKKKGLGAIVLKRKRYKDLFEFKSYSDEAKDKGEIPGNIIIACKEVEASVRVSEMLQIEPGDKVCYLKRLRLRNGRVTALHETYISLEFGFRITNDDFNANTSLYEFYEEHGIELGYANETIEVKMPNHNLRTEMFMTQNEPIFYRERITYDINGKPIEFSQNNNKAEQYRYALHMVKKTK